MSDPTYEELKPERLESYKKVWRWFLWLGWPAAFFVLWLGGRIINGLHGRLLAQEGEISRLKSGGTP